MIKPVDLGICQGYEYEGDSERTAVALPGSMLAGMPALWYVFEPLLGDGWRIVLVWDQFLERTEDPTEWSRVRADAARGWTGIWLTPLLGDDECVAGLRRRTAPALLVGGSADPTWNGRLARELSDDVLELDGADHGLARIDQAQLIADAVRAFA